MKNTGMNIATSMAKSTMMNTCKLNFRNVSKVKMENTDMTDHSIYWLNIMMKNIRMRYAMNMV